MTRREAVLSAGGIFLVAVVVRVVFANGIGFPKAEDSAYYFGVARNLVEGRGLVSDAVWSYQTPPLVIPRPAFEVWLPLPSLLAAIPMWLAGPTFASALVAAVLIGAAVPVLAWRVAADVAAERHLPPGRARTLALGTGLTSAVYLPLVLQTSLADSSMPFAALALGACLVMTRLVRLPRPATPGLVGLGILLGLGALTRNEAVWVGLAWLVIAAGVAAWSRRERVAAVVVPALVAGVIYLPWAIRDWAVFGSPLPGQAVTNALSVTGFDIFAWNDPPTLARYLALGPATLVQLRVDGFVHNLVDDLLLPGVPLSLIGLIGLPWALRGSGAAIRPLALVAILTFAITTIAFPVSTTWGTFLHAAGPAQVLLVLSALLALDAVIVRIGSWRGWTRPVAWLGPALGVAGSVLFSFALLPGYGSAATATAAQYQELAARMAAAGHPLDASAGPVITDAPIRMAETERIPALALPDEDPPDILDLARQFPGTRLLVIVGGQHGRWPAVIDVGGYDDCFRELDLGPGPAGEPDPLAGTRVFEIVCP